MKHFRWEALALMAVLVVSTASASTIDFTGAFSGPFFQFNANGTNAQGTVITLNGAQITYMGITLTGYYWNGSAWTTQGVNLIGRNAPAGQSIDHGIGVCVALGVSGNEDCNDGDQNEISNQKYQEILQISKAPGTLPWTTLGLSSLDVNGNDKPVEHGQLYSSNLNPNEAGFPTVAMANVAGKVSFICEFLNGAIQAGTNPAPTCTSANGGTPPNSEEPDLSFGPNSDAYLFLQALNSVDDPTHKNNNDFLIRSIGDPGTQVPEPSSLMLLATGLAGASLGIRRKFRG